MSWDWKCWPGVMVSQYWPLESLSITVKPAELLRARQDGRGRWTVTRLSPDSWPVSKAPKAAVTTECRHFDWRWVKNTVQLVILNKGISALAKSSWRRNPLDVASYPCPTKMPLKARLLKSAQIRHVIDHHVNEETAAHLPVNFGWNDGAQIGAWWRKKKILFTEIYLQVYF